MRNDEDLDRLESLCREIATTPTSRRTEKALWDYIERMAQEVLVLRLQMETEQWNTEWWEEASSLGNEGIGRVMVITFNPLRR